VTATFIPATTQKGHCPALSFADKIGHKAGLTLQFRQVSLFKLNPVNPVAAPIAEELGARP
jgi:hypothetical protein